MKAEQIGVPLILPIKNIQNEKRIKKVIENSGSTNLFHAWLTIERLAIHPIPPSGGSRHLARGGTLCGGSRHLARGGTLCGGSRHLARGGTLCGGSRHLARGGTLCGRSRHFTRGG